MGSVVSLVRRGSNPVQIAKDRQATPARLPDGAATAAYTWDGRVAVQNPQIYRHWAKTSEWVRGAITIRRAQVSSAEWDIVPYDQRKPYSKRQAERIKNLFRTPNPANDSYRTFIEPVTEDLLTLDAGCIEKVRTLSGDLVQLWPVNAAHVKINALWEGDPRATRYYWYPDGFKESARWRNEDLIYMMMNPRTDTPLGLPALETLRAAVEAEMNAHEYNRRQVENAAPDGIINLGEGFTEPQVNRFREFFESEVAGRGPLGFIGGSKAPSFIKFRDSNRDQQFLEWQVYLVRKIAVVFGLTPQDLGVTFDINRSTSEIQLQVSEDRGLRPLMSGIQEYLTEEIVWDRSFGGAENNLAFRFTALNLKESTAKAAIYEKALAGVPWRFVNEARIDEGREPIPGMEGKLIMATPTGAVNIMDVPTVREQMDAQTAAKKPAPPAAGKSTGDAISDVVPVIAEALRAHLESDRDQSGDQSAAILRLAEAYAQNQQPVNVETTIAEGAIRVNQDSAAFTELVDSVRSMSELVANQEAPVVNVAAPVVNVAQPDISVEALDVTPIADVVRELRELLAKQAQMPAEQLKPVTRREVKRDAAGRIVEVIDHRGE